jgi:hypothetical protein
MAYSIALSRVKLVPLPLRLTVGLQSSHCGYASAKSGIGATRNLQSATQARCFVQPDRRRRSVVTYIATISLAIAMVSRAMGEDDTKTERTSKSAGSLLFGDDQISGTMPVGSSINESDAYNDSGTAMPITQVRSTCQSRELSSFRVEWKVGLWHCQRMLACVRCKNFGL